MSLSSDLISQFVKATKDTTKAKNETTVYGTTVEYNGSTYVRLDGSDLLTPISTTTATKPGERVTVMIKNHTATVTGNMSSPAARTGDVKEVASKITEFEIVMAYKVTTEDLEATNAVIENLRARVAKFDNIDAVNAEIDNLEATFADLEYVSAVEMEAITANIERLEATFADITDISTEELDALHADIATLTGYTADFTYVSADVLQAVKAAIDELDVKKLSAEQANLMYANIDFSNIGKAAMEKFYADSGLIRDVVVGDGTITGHLVGVTISGDLIEGNTVKADKLVVKGSDGLYYKLNFEGGKFAEGEAVPDDSLHGSVITAKSITAEKVRVDDLVAFDATIGGFHLTKDAIYSGVKESVDNTTQGIYMDKTGQMALGDDRNFIKYYLDEETGDFKLEISADSILLSSRSKSIEEAFDELQEAVDNIEIGARNLLLGTGTGLGWVYHTIDVNTHAMSIQNGSTSYADGTLITHSAYPLTDDTTLIFTGMTGSMGNTTLTLSGEHQEMFIHNGKSPISLKAGQAYTLSFYAKRDNANRTVDMCVVDIDGNSAEYVILENKDILSSINEFVKFEYTFTPTIDHNESVLVRFDLNSGDGDVTTLTIKDIKLERGTVATDWIEAPEDVEQSIVDTADELRTSMAEQNASIINTCTEIILSAVESRVDISDYETFKSTVEAQLSVMADKILMNFTTTESRVDSVDGDLQTKFTELYKYISFSDDGITIGGNESGITLTLDNDGIMFRKNGIAFGRWDGVDFYTGNIIVEVNERAQFGNFSFLPRPDGSLSFLMTAQTSLPIVEVVDNVMIIKNTNSIFNGTITVVEDIVTTKTNTTITLEV